MLNDATGLKKIYLAAGYTDLRRGMDDALSFLREEDGPDQGTLMGRGWVPASWKPRICFARCCGHEWKIRKRGPSLSP